VFYHLISETKFSRIKQGGFPDFKTLKFSVTGSLNIGDFAVMFISTAVLRVISVRMAKKAYA